MKNLFVIFLQLIFVLSCKQIQNPTYNSINTHPENSNYFIYHDNPLILITSDQHYGAVINLDFDYIEFLDTISSYGLNFTRIYPGAYIEKDGEYMKDNNLGARNGRQILPWVKTSIPGAHEVLGRYKLDLDQWNDAYFKRLKDFISRAKDRDIIVDIAFFNGMYPDRWEYQPLYHANNIQGVGTCVFNMVQTLSDSALVMRHEAYVKKITEEVNEFDNVILDICDEPFQDGCPPELYSQWISKLIDVILTTESSLPNKHLIAQTIDSHTRYGPGDFSADPRVVVLMNEYTWGIANLDKEYIHNKPMVLIETCYYPHYPGDKIAASRVEAWEFIVGGGAGFMHLNGLYSTFNSGASGTENSQLLNQLKILKNFMNDLDFIKMRQDTSFIREVPGGAFARAISEPGKQYAFYIHHSIYGGWYWEPMNMRAAYNVAPGKYNENMAFNLGPGKYTAEWIDPATGAIIRKDQFTHDGGNYTFNTPVYQIDIALKIKSISQ